MRPVRIWFRKVGTTRYISHLDLNRCISRAIHRAKIPLWYTQGYNPRAFLTFALPLSLGVAGERESVDIKLDDDGTMTNEEIIDRLNGALPDDIPIFAVTEPVMKPGKIAYASYEMLLDSEGQDAEAIAGQIDALIHAEKLTVKKHTKSGLVDFDIRPYLDHIKVFTEDEKIRISAVLPAGSTMNVNPSLILDAVKNELGIDLYTQIQRTNLYDENLKNFE